MPLVEKELIPGPGTYYYVDQKTGLPRAADFTADYIEYLHDSGQEMLAAGLSIPVPKEHGGANKVGPMTPAELLDGNTGFVKGFKLGQNHSLSATLDIADPELCKRLPHTVKFVSPWINSFVDGKGKKWNGVISHVALTLTPRIHDQKPFDSIAAALSVTGGALREFRRAAPPEEPLLVSRAGSLHLKDAAYVPDYPMAFSLWSGIKLAREEMPPKKEPAKKEPPAKEPPKGRGGAEPPAEPEGSPPEAEPEIPGLEAPASKVTPDGDISVVDVLVDLLSAEGYHMPEGTTKENFFEHFYESLMDCLRQKKGEEDMGLEPETPVTPPAKAPQAQAAPPIKEQQPMYMSIEAINAIADPTMKSIALSMHAQIEKESKRSAALEKNLFDAARRRRDIRVSRLSQILPAEAKATLDKLCQGATFAIGEDGVVQDSMNEVLTILEQGVKDVPALLKTPQAQVVEQNHPEDYLGQMSEARRKSVADELAAAGGVVPAA